MALVERYVSALASGGGDGSEANPWTLAEALANAAAGDRVNIKADGTYTVSANPTPTNDGSKAAPIIFRGYKTTIGDGYQGRDNDTGALNTSNMPTIDLGSSYYWDHLKAWWIFESLNITGSLNGSMVYVEGTGQDSIFKSCSVKNTGTGASAIALNIQQDVFVYDCDIETGGTHTALYFSGWRGRAIQCRLRAPNGYGAKVNNGDYSYFAYCLFYECSYGAYLLTGSANYVDFYGCTFVDIKKDAIGTQSDQRYIVGIINCMATDNGRFVNLYAQNPTFIVNARTRDNTSANNNLGDWPIYNEVTTDTGGQETDYADASNDDYTLIASSPAVGEGPRSKADIGAYPNRGAFGGGGGSIGMAGMFG